MSIRRPFIFALFLLLGAGTILLLESPDATAQVAQRQFQGQITVTAAAASAIVYMPIENVADISRYKAVVVRYRFDDSAVPSGTPTATLTLQTAMTLQDAREWKDIGSGLAYVEGTSTLPDLKNEVIDIDDTNPALMRYLRWKLAWTSATAGDSVTFNIAIAGHR